ncbi:MAG: ATP synthase F1 subunit delta [Myxococcales bacterium]|nr:ATP synthase F1 subunit delta [Myxococcales bacterium]
MRGLAVGRRYAKALLELVSDAASVERVGRQLDELAATWEGSRELREACESPRVGAEARRRVLDAIAARMGLDATVRGLLRMLGDRRRLRLLPDVAAAYRALCEQRAGRLHAEVTTATPMPEGYYTELAAVLERISGRKVVLVRRTDPEVLGGVVARLGGRVLDGSLRTRLRELEDTLLER